MRTRDAVKIANRIVKHFFLECGKDPAKRLVLEMPGRPIQGSGWCRDAVRDVIVDGLKSKPVKVRGG